MGCDQHNPVHQSAILQGFSVAAAESSDTVVISGRACSPSHLEATSCHYF